MIKFEKNKDNKSFITKFFYFFANVIIIQLRLIRFNQINTLIFFVIFYTLLKVFNNTKHVDRTRLMWYLIDTE